MIRIVASYSDGVIERNILDELTKHLKTIEGVEWEDFSINDPSIPPNEVSDSLARADIILLLISPSYLDESKNFDHISLAQFQLDSGNAEVIPIAVRPVHLRTINSKWFGKLTPLPANWKFVSDSDNRDRAFVEITDGVYDVIDDIKERRYQNGYKALVERNKYPFNKKAEERLEKLRRDSSLDKETRDKIEKCVLEERQVYLQGLSAYEETLKHFSEDGNLDQPELISLKDLQRKHHLQEKDVDKVKRKVLLSTGSGYEIVKSYLREVLGFIDRYTLSMFGWHTSERLSSVTRVNEAQPNEGLKKFIPIALLTVLPSLLIGYLAGKIIIDFNNGFPDHGGSIKVKPDPPQPPQPGGSGPIEVKPDSPQPGGSGPIEVKPDPPQPKGSAKTRPSTRIKGSEPIPGSW